MERARDELVAAIGEHGAAWVAEVAESVEAMAGQWQAVTGEMIALHGRLTASLRVARAIGIGDLPQVGALPFMRRQIDNCDFAAGQPPVPAFIETGAVLAALARVIEVEPVAEKTPVQHPHLKGASELRGQGRVEDEIDEREAFHSPECVAERRRRSEQNRQAGEQALSESLAG